MRIRHYEIVESTPDVKERVVRALCHGAVASLNAELADVYEGEPPIPADILRREVAFDIFKLSVIKRGSLKALGFTSEGAAVSVTIPHDEDKRSTLSLVDTTPISKARSYPDNPK